MYLPDYKNCQILIMGMGYVGLPLAVEFAKQKICVRNNLTVNRNIVGFDISKSRIKELEKGFDKTNEYASECDWEGDIHKYYNYLDK